MAHASTLILFVRDLIHETKNTSGTGSTLSIVFARATSRLARMSPFPGVIAEHAHNLKQLSLSPLFIITISQIVIDVGSFSIFAVMLHISE